MTPREYFPKNWTLFRAAESARFGIEPIVSDITEDRDGIPMTTSASSWGGESGCSEWLQFMSHGACLCTVVFFQSGGKVYIWTVYTCWESVGVLQVTGSLLHVVPRFCADLLLHLGRVVGGICRTVPQDCFVDVMATGNGQPEADRKGIDFRVHGTCANPV